MEINIKNIDETKADLGLRHEYVPDTVSNNALEEDKRVVVECEYLRVGERSAFFSVSADDKEVNMDLYRKIFRKKVKGIRNLVINKKPVTTAEEFLRYPSEAQLEGILIDVGLHIIKADSLTEDEEKN